MKSSNNSSLASCSFVSGHVRVDEACSDALPRISESDSGRVPESDSNYDQLAHHPNFSNFSGPRLTREKIRTRQMLAGTDKR